MATKVTPLSNGPIRIEGEFTIHDSTGAEFGLPGAGIELGAWGYAVLEKMKD